MKKSPWSKCGSYVRTIAWYLGFYVQTVILVIRFLLAVLWRTVVLLMSMVLDTILVAGIKLCDWMLMLIRSRKTYIEP